MAMILDDGTVLKMDADFLYGYGDEDNAKRAQGSHLHRMGWADFAMKVEGRGRFVLYKCRDLEPWISRVRTVAPSLTPTEETTVYRKRSAPVYAMSETDHMMLKLWFG